MIKNWKINDSLIFWQISEKERKRNRERERERDELVNEWGVSKGESFGSKFSIYISPVLGKIVIMVMHFLL